MSTHPLVSLRHGVTPGVWVLRCLVAAGLLLALVCGIPEGYTPPIVLVVFVLAAGVFAAFRPDHLAVSLAMGVVIFWWMLQLRFEMPTAALVAAAGITLSHVAATLLAYGPPHLPVDPRLALLWAMRGVTTWTGALVVWVVARAYTGHGSPELYWLAGLAAAVVGAVAVGATAPLRRQERRS
jgi:hypothetical protein